MKTGLWGNAQPLVDYTQSTEWAALVFTGLVFLVSLVATVKSITHAKGRYNVNLAIMLVMNIVSYAFTLLNRYWDDSNAIICFISYWGVYFAMFFSIYIQFEFLLAVFTLTAINFDRSNLLYRMRLLWCIWYGMIWSPSYLILFTLGNTPWPNVKMVK